MYPIPRAHLEAHQTRAVRRTPQRQRTPRTPTPAKLRADDIGRCRAWRMLMLVSGPAPYVLPPPALASNDTWVRRSVGALITLAVAGLWVAHIGQNDPTTIDWQSKLWAPILLFSGLHWRQAPFLHAEYHGRAASLPIPALRHGRSAAYTHLLRWLPTLACAVVIDWASGDRSTAPTRELLPLVAWCMVVEPWVVAIMAYAGRRFPEDSVLHRWQGQLGGGWTTREAAIHLYAPAMGLVSAATLAMPVALALESLSLAALVGQPWFVGYVCIFLLSIAATMRWAPRLFAAGYHEASVRIVEAKRSVSGPEPDLRAPAWLLRISSDPARRLLLVHIWRSASISGLRLFSLVAGSAWIATRSASPVFASALVCMWIAPTLYAWSCRHELTQAWASLPLARPAREGRDFGTCLIACAPGLIPLIALLLASPLGTGP